MKVKDFIFELQKLDQEREIYVEYDGSILLDPWDSIEEATQEDVYEFQNNNEKELNFGDYLIQAWV